MSISKNFCQSLARIFEIGGAVSKMHMGMARSIAGGNWSRIYFKARLETVDGRLIFNKNFVLLGLHLRNVSNCWVSLSQNWLVSNQNESYQMASLETILVLNFNHIIWIIDII